MKQQVSLFLIFCFKMQISRYPYGTICLFHLVRMSARLPPLLCEVLAKNGNLTSSMNVFVADEVSDYCFFLGLTCFGRVNVSDWIWLNVALRCLGIISWTSHVWNRLKLLRFRSPVSRYFLLSTSTHVPTGTGTCFHADRHVRRYKRSIQTAGEPVSVCGLMADETEGYSLHN